jgi:hypothetical protein
MIKTKDAGFIVNDELLRSCSLVALAALRDLFMCAKHLFVAAIADGDAAPGSLRSAVQAQLSAVDTNSPKK